MTDVVDLPAAPVAHARVVYLGPVSPHWEVYGDWVEDPGQLRTEVFYQLARRPAQPTA